MVRKPALWAAVIMLVPVLLQAEIVPADSNNPDSNTTGDSIVITDLGFCSCDLVHDGIVDFYDFALLAGYWGADDCWVNSNWCDGADINQDNAVNFKDLRYLAVLCWLDEDNEPPSPDPMQWDRSLDGQGFDGRPREVHLPPYGPADYAATMRADPNTADCSDYEFYFECMDDYRFSSGWVYFPGGPPYEYTISIGWPNFGWRFRVKARDRSINSDQNITGWSEIVIAE